MGRVGELECQRAHEGTTELARPLGQQKRAKDGRSLRYYYDRPRDVTLKE